MSSLNTPSIQLVDAIAHKEHPVARYCPKGRPARIEFSKIECSKLDDDVLEFAVYHELGHWWRLTRLKPTRSTFRVFPVTSSADNEERFADGFAIYFLNRSRLSKWHPKAEALLEQSLGSSEDEVYRFGRTTHRWLLEQLQEGR